MFVCNWKVSPVTEIKIPALLQGLTHAQVERALRAAKDLAGKAARQHKDAIEWAHATLRGFYDEHKVGLQEATPGCKWAVVVHQADVSKHSMDHIVSIEQSSQGSVDNHMEIAVSTASEMGGTSDSFEVRYRTKTRVIADGLFGEIQHDAVVGAVIT